MRRLKDETSFYQAILLTCLTTLLSGCLHSPRSSFFPEKQNPEEATSTQGSRKSTSAITPRFRDTTYQHLHDKDANLVVQSFAAAQSDFDEQHFDAAIKNCEQLIETLDDSDSLNGEARFLLAESWIQTNQLSSAADVLRSTLKLKTLHGDLHARTLLRLGQVCCLQNKGDEARQRFAEFKKSYPSSPFIQLAQCTAAAP